MRWSKYYGHLSMGKSQIWEIHFWHFKINLRPNFDHFYWTRFKLVVGNSSSRTASYSSKRIAQETKKKIASFYFSKDDLLSPKIQPFQWDAIGWCDIVSNDNSITDFFLKNGVIQASISVYFRLFNMSQLKFKIKLIKA